MQRKIRISEICEIFGLQFIGEDLTINGLNLCNRDSRHDCILTYVTNENYMEAVCSNKAIAGIILEEKYLSSYEAVARERNVVYILCGQPESVFYDIHEHLYNNTDFYEKYNFESRIGADCEIHQSTVIENGVIIGNKVTIGPNTVVRRGTVIKDFCTIGCNSTIGSEGFQILRVDGANRKIAHCGGVLLNEHVLIGDNTTICNSLFEETTCIGKNAMIDNLVYVGHNVQIGNDAVITAGTMLCGSSIVESKAWIGVNSSVLNKVVVGKNSKLGMGSVATRDVPDGAVAYGVPAKTKILWGGGRKLGAKVLQWLCTLQWAEILAVVPVPSEFDSEAAEEIRLIIEENHLNECSMEAVRGMKFDIGLSINYHRIIPEDILKTCEKGFYNVHHSHNLRLRGRNITTHAILNCRKENVFYHGTTLHKMIPELDAGPIVASAACKIEDTDTAYSLFQKTDDLALHIVKEWFPRIVFQKIYPYIPSEEGVHYYKNSDLPSKEIMIDELDSNEVYDFVRAFDYPGYSPAFIKISEQKIHLVIYKRGKYSNKIFIKNKLYYTDSNICNDSRWKEIETICS